MTTALSWKVGVAAIGIILAGVAATEIAARNKAMELAKEYGHVRKKATNAPEVRITTTEGAKKLIPHLAHVPDLYKVGIYAVPLTSDQLTEINKLSGVDTLHLAGCDLTDEHVALLSEMSWLETLDISGNPITDKSLVSIGKLTRLKKLDLSQTAIDGHLLGELHGLSNLWRIRLTGTSVSDETVGELTQIRKLRELSLNGTEVSADGLKLLANLHWLQLLALPEERVFGKSTRENITQRKEAKWKFIAEFNELKRKAYQEASAEGLEIPDRFVSPFPEKRWGEIEPSE